MTPTTKINISTMNINNNNKSSPKLFGKSTSLPLIAENAAARFVCCLLCNVYYRWVQSVSCGYATSTLQCHMRPVSYTALLVSPSLPQQKRFSPSVTGEINAQSSHWNNWKMKIASNSAYVQIEMFNFTLPSKPLLCISIFVPTSKTSLCQMPDINVQCKLIIFRQ